MNVSGVELSDSDYLDGVLAALTTSGLAPERLVLEVTETTIGADADPAMAMLARLRARGIRVAIDDFGVGYSSLGRLNRLPVDILKLDRSFVMSLDTDGTDQAMGASNGGPELVEAIAAIAAAVGLSTIAEGFEHPEQAEQLADIGFIEGQGYLFGRPGPIEDVLRHLTAPAIPRARQATEAHSAALR